MTTADVLVLGGTGLLGPAVCRALIARGARVHACNRGRHLERLPAGVTHSQVDRRDAAGVGAARDVAAPVVIDTAAAFPETLPSLAAQLHGAVRTVLVLSSVAVYRDAGGPPRDEGSAVGAHPVWGALGESKLRCEAAWREVGARRDARVIVLRPAHLSEFDDPLGREASICAGLLAGRELLVPGDGAARLQFAPVDDVAELCARLAEEPPAHDIYDVANPVVWTIRGWLGALAQASGVAPALCSAPFSWDARGRFPYWPGDVVVTGARLQRELGWVPAAALPPVVRREER